jgi:23S rRNA (uracil1939-C5)-methyltransferase
VTHDIHILTPHDLAVTGKSVAKLDGMTVFLDKGLPGETVRAEITARKKRFAEARVLESVSPSPDERPSFCEYGGTCGGCAWTNLAYEAECAWKERQVKETLRRIGKVDVGNGMEYLPIQPSPHSLHYRNKMEFAFGLDESGSPALGLRKRLSHTVVSVNDCPLHAQSVQAILSHARNWLRDNNLSVWDGTSGFCRFLVIRTPDYVPPEFTCEDSRQCVIECITAPGTQKEKQAVAAFGKSLMDSGNATGFVHSIRKNRENVAYGETIATALGETVITEKIGHLTVTAPVQAFLQANTPAATLLYDQVCKYAGERPGVVWDMYCGIGGIGLYLADENTILRGIETVPEAVQFAKRNAKDMPGDIAFVSGGADAAFRTLAPAPDVVIIDPPRAGMEEKVVSLLLREKPRRIIAVSCDAASLARDIAALAPLYTVKSARAFDLFPKTPHVEVISLLERRN